MTPYIRVYIQVERTARYRSVAGCTQANRAIAILNWPLIAITKLNFSI